MEQSAEMQSPAGPKPRRRSSRPAISVVSCATTIWRPAQAAAVQDARVSIISPVVTEGADRTDGSPSRRRDHSQACARPAIWSPSPARSAWCQPPHDGYPQNNQYLHTVAAP